MARGSRLALVLVVALAVASATPALGDRTRGVGETGIAGPTAVQGNLITETPSDEWALSDELAQSDETQDDETQDNETQDDDAIEIETEGFDPSYDPETVLERVEELRGLEATQGITLHEYDEEEASRYDMRDEFVAIRPAGAQALQLYSNASTERRTPLGYAVERQAAVHIYLMNASDLEAYGVPQDAVLAHEFVHALQFQHDLLSPSREGFRSEFSRWTTDSALVTTALVEGDAMWVTEQYFERYVGPEGNYSVADYNRTLARAAWPHSVAGTPYYYGYEFYEQVGSSPEDRSAAIRSPPHSTAELLHPSEPVERAPLPEPPQVVDADNLTRFHTDTVGELVLRHAFRMNGFSYARASEAAAGWANGRMYYYAAEGATGPVTHWVTVWEDDAEAREFLDAWRSMLDANGATELDDGTLVVPASDHAPAVYYVVSRDDETVRITAASTEELAERLASADD